MQFNRLKSSNKVCSLIGVLSMSMLISLMTCGCQKEADSSAGRAFAEGLELVCPVSTQKAEVTNSSYPEYFCVGLDGRQGPWMRFDVHGRIQIRTEYVKDHVNGKWTQYHADGSVETEGQIVNDMREGEWKQYYVNGKPRSIKHYQNSILHGRVELYYQEGGLMAEGDYVNGAEEGTWKVYTPETKLARECQMVHGEEKDCIVHIEDFKPSTYQYNSRERGAL